MAVAFTQPQKLLELSTMAAAAILVFAQMSPEERAQAATEINEQLGNWVAEFKRPELR